MEIVVLSRTRVEWSGRFMSYANIPYLPIERDWGILLKGAIRVGGHGFLKAVLQKASQKIASDLHSSVETS